MALKINTEYGQALTSAMLNEKVNSLTNSNAILDGLEVTKDGSSVYVAPGKCIISGAIIESDDVIVLQAPQGQAIFVGIEYIHGAKTANFFAKNTGDISKNGLLIAKISNSAIECEDKMRTLCELSSSLKTMRDGLLDEQYLEYEGENIKSDDSVDGVTSELKIKGQTILNVAPIKEEVNVYADLQAAKNGSVKFDNTGDGIIDGVNIDGKTYQNLLPETDFLIAGGATYNYITNNPYEANLRLTSGGSKVFHKRLSLKKSTPYTFVFDFRYNGTSQNNVVIGFLNNTAFDVSRKNIELVKDGKYWRVVGCITTPDSIECVAAVVGFHGNAAVSEEMGIKNFILLEGDHVSQANILPAYIRSIKGTGDKSKNLFNGRVLTNKSMDQSGIVDSPDRIITEYMDANANTQYVSNQSFNNLYCFDKDKSWLGICAYNEKVMRTLPNTKYIVGNYIASKTNINTLQIEEGIASTKYESYYEGNRIQIDSCGKNLFGSFYSIRSGEGVVEAVDTSSCSVSIKTTAAASWVATWIYYKVKPNTTYNIRCGSVVGLRKWIAIRNDESALIKDLPDASGSFNTGNNTIIRIMFYCTLADSEVSETTYSNIMLEETSTPSPYEPYKESKITHYLREPLMSLPNGVHDEIIGNKLIRRVGKIALDGSEAWKGFLLEPSGLGRIILYDIPNLKPDATTMCDTLIPVKWSSSPWNFTDNCISSLREFNHFYIYLKNIKSVYDGKQWLSQNPTTVYYELATPIITPVKGDTVLLNGVQDRIVGDIAKRNVRKKILNGTEEWGASGSNPGTSDYVVFYHNSHVSHGFDGVTNGVKEDFLCDKIFKPEAMNDNTTMSASTSKGEFITGHFNEGLNEIRISILKSRLSSLDTAGFKKWLSENPITVHYQLLNPYESPADNNIVLPNGVHDEIVNGKVLRRVGKISLRDYDKAFGLGTFSTNPDMAYFTMKTTPASKIPLATECTVLSDKFKTVVPSKYTYNEEMIYAWHDNSSIYIHILKSRLDEVNSDGFKRWLAKNPVTIWYELAEPYYDISRNPQLNSYKGQTNLVGSTLVPTSFNIESYGYRKEALIKPNTKYTIHFKNKYTSADFRNIKVDLGGAIGNITANGTWLMLTLTTPTTLTHKELRISGYGVSVSEVMCNQGDEYRTFVDGLESVGVKSNNLLNERIGYTPYSVYSAGRYDGGKICLDNSPNITNRCVYVMKAYFEIGDTYVVSFSNEKILSGGYNKEAILCNKSTDSEVLFRFVGNTPTKFNLPSGEYYVRIATTYDKLCKIEFNCQIEKTKITPYRPYNDGYKVELSSNNKNLINSLNKGVYSSNGITITPTNDNCYIINGTATKQIAHVISTADGSLNNTIELIQGKTYTLSDNSGLSSEALFIQFACKAVNTEQISYFDTRSNGRYTYKPNENLMCRCIIIIREGATLNNVIIKPMMEESSYPTTYSQYQSDKLNIILPEPLRSLPNGVCDTIEKINGQYVVMRRCKEIVLDGSEAWDNPVNGSAGAGTLSKIYNLIKRLDVCDNVNVNLCCDRLASCDANYLWATDIEGASLNAGGALHIRMKSEKLSSETSSAFKEWLKKNPVTIIYKAFTPTTHPLNAVQLPNGVIDTVNNGDRTRNVGKVILDGSEEWAIQSTNNNNNGLVNFGLGFSGNMKQNPSSACDRFNFGAVIANEKLESFLIGGNTIYIRKLVSSGITTIDKFKQWLSENPTTIWYELATPTQESYVGPNISVDTFDDVTHISSNTLVPAIINAKIPTNVGSIIKTDIERIERIESWIDNVILPSLVESHYQKTLLEFDYEVSRMLQ